MDSQNMPPVQAIYRPVDDEVWRRLYRQQTELVPSAAPPVYLRGLALLDLPTDHVPDLDQVNERLHALTGWTLVAVDGLVPASEFFEMLWTRRFPVTRRIRTPEEIGFSELPDLFHDIFGHGPFLTDPSIAHLYQEFGRIGLRCATRPGERELLEQIMWTTLEAGMIRTPDGLRALGGAILSSAAEIEHCLDPECPTEPFDLDVVRGIELEILQLQKTYFVVESLDEVEVALAHVDSLITLGQPS